MLRFDLIFKTIYLLENNFKNAFSDHYFGWRRIQKFGWRIQQVAGNSKRNVGYDGRNDSLYK
jgi:hypothetical protein